MKRMKARDFDREVLDLFDGYVHGDISRREFLDRAKRHAVGGVTAVALLESLSPKYAEAQQIAPDDERLKTEFVEYDSPRGYGKVKAQLSRPAGSTGKLPGVVVIHENRGLNPHIEDVARRTGLAGYLALAPDGLTPLGGYPGTDDEGRKMQRTLDRDKLLAGVSKACAKRPVSIEAIEALVSGIEGKLYSRGEREVESRLIGEMVMERLRELDDVAYVRYASVYRRFADVESLAEEIEKLLERKRREGEA